MKTNKNIYCYISDIIKLCVDFFATGSIATIKHRCVTPLYGRNSIGQGDTFLHKLKLPKAYLWVIMMLFIITGCYKLDRYPPNLLSAGTAWKHEDHAKQAMMGVYGQMKTNQSLGTLFCDDAASDIAIGYNSPVSPEVFLGTYTGLSGIVLSKWQHLYEGVMRANLVLQNVPSIPMSDELKNRYYSEAKFMRALYYFELYTYYGKIPIYDESVVVEKDFSNMKYPRNSEADVITFILKDLADAINNLPVSWPKADYGRATKGAAYALRGKVYLYDKKYSEAKADFEEIVLDPSGKGYGYGLYPNYADLFKPGGDESNEMIFAIQNLGGIGTEYGMQMCLYMGTRAAFMGSWNNLMPSNTLVNMYEYKNGKPFDWDELIPGFSTNSKVRDSTFRAKLTSNNRAVQSYPEKLNILRQMYDERDPRMDQTIILPYTKFLGWVSNAEKMCEYVIATGVNEANGFVRSNTSWASCFFRKFVPEGNMGGKLTSRSDTPINFPILRFADVLLMLAECHNKLGDINSAVACINRVRQRPSTNMALINNGDPWMSATTEDEVFKRIMHERAVELAAEGHRYKDLRRWGVAKSMLNKNETSIFGDLLYKRVFTDKDYLWPVPTLEVEMNPALNPNNPGW